MRRTGKWAYVDGIPCTTSWSLNRSASVERYQASCTPDASGTTEGNINWTGTMAGIGYLPPFPTEDDYAFIGVASGKAGELMNYEADVLVNEVTISIPVSSSGPVRWTASFGVQGDVTQETATSHVDATRNPAPAAKHGKIAIEGTPDSGTYTDVAAVQDITLVFRRGATTYVDNGFTYREVGNLESEVSFRVENDDLFVANYALNGTKRLRAYVSPTQFFLFDAITFREHTNYTVDRVANAMIGYNVSGWWTAIRQRTPPALGTIVLPNGTILYPAP